MAANDYALLIGITHYPDFQNLEGPYDDANALKGWIVDPAGGDTPADQIELVDSIPKPPTPVQDMIDQAILRLKKMVEAKHNKKGRRLYVYFSGHGFADEDDDNSLCMANWSREDYRHSAISSRGYLKYLKDIGYFKEIIFFLDCCRNSVPSVQGKNPDIGVVKPSGESIDTKSLIVYASQFLYQAFEAQGEKPTGFVRGYFSNALLRALGGEAADHSGNVTAQSVVDFLKVEVPQLANQDSYTQETQLQTTFQDLSKVVLARYIPKTPFCTIRCSGRTGQIKIENGKLEQVATFDADVEEFQQNLLPGLYNLIETTTSLEKIIKVSTHEPNQTFTF